jgi:multisubunit Na+/H+ antiporter MnhC subunit
MIITLFLNLIFWVINLILSLLPSGGTFPPEIQTGIATGWTYVNALNDVLPLTAIITCVSIMITFYVWSFIWNVMHYIFGKMPGFK